MDANAVLFLSSAGQDDIFEQITQTLPLLSYLLTTPPWIQIKKRQFSISNS